MKGENAKQGIAKILKIELDVGLNFEDFKFSVKLNYIDYFY